MRNAVVENLKRRLWVSTLLQDPFLSKRLIPTEGSVRVTGFLVCVACLFFCIDEARSSGLEGAGGVRPSATAVPPVVGGSAALAQRPEAPPQRAAMVSLVALLARPREYDGKIVQVVGFAHLEFEGNGLYLHREDFEQGLVKNSVWVDISGQRARLAPNDRYVIVEGVFNARNNGHMGLRSGSLERVTRFDAWPSRKEMDER